MKRTSKFFLMGVWAAIIALVFSCAALGQDPSASGTPRPASGSPAAVSDTVSVATFNIQVFGEKKADKPEVMKILARIIANFDVVAIQEVRDDKEQAIKKLKQAVDALGRDYGVLLSPRLGRTTSKEQYAFLYRKDTLQPVGQPHLYQEPPGTDPFHRQPYVAEFKSKKGNFDFVLINIHTDPDEATEEIRALKEALAYARKKHPWQKDFIILGDLNADCHYYDKTQPNPIPGTTWLLPLSADTTVKSTPCTYDNIIVTDACREDFTGEVQVFRFDREYGLSNQESLKVSDHYPVWARFSTNRDTD